MEPAAPSADLPVDFGRMATERDLYAVLGVERNASDAEIKRAFRRLAQQWHPDVNRDTGADLRFKEINQAYQVLSDPQRRQAYDMFGTVGDGAETGDFSGGFGSFSDIFDAFFGGTQPGTRRGHPLAGADLRYDLRITLEEAVKGVEKEIEFSILGRCETCSGSGAKAGSEPVTCEQCGGRGEIRSTRRTMLGQMVNVTTCPRCQGEGKLDHRPVRDVPWRRPHGTSQDPPRDDPGRHRRGPPDQAVE